MADHFNPDAPLVRGLQWFPTGFATEPVDAGPAWVQLLPSRGAETIEQVAMAATGDTGASGHLHTLVEVIPVGDEAPGSVQVVDLLPTGDGPVGNWVTDTSASSDLWQALQEPVEWPRGTVEPYISTGTSLDVARFHVDAADFAASGPLENARICRVSLAAVVLSLTVGQFISLRFSINDGGTVYEPSGSVIAANNFGHVAVPVIGEMNMDSVMPWTPADLAEFAVGGTRQIQVRSETVPGGGTVAVLAFGLRVHYIAQENRVAVGRWTRSGPPPTGIFRPETVDFRSMPDGTPGWDKPGGGDFLWVWRQARTPGLHAGGTLQKDTRWLRAFQDLGPDGNPPGTAPPPSGILADRLTFDDFGLATGPFTAGFVSGAAIAPLLTGGAASEDAQPYRLTLLDFAVFGGASGTIGQAITPDASSAYAGVRAVVAVPATGGGTLTISVHEVGGAQVGGVATWTANQVRAIAPPGGGGSARYIEGFFDVAVSLTNGVQYEVRFSATGSGWAGFMLDASTGPDASFGGTTDGAFIGAVMQPDRDLEVALTAAPAEPDNVAADIVTVCAPTYACVDEIQHVRLSWTPGEPLLGATFDHYDIQRRVTPLVDSEPPTEAQWETVVRIGTEATSEWVDRTVARDHNVRYRIRALGAGGAISVWVESNVVTPTATGCEVILTSQHDPDLEVVYERTPETRYSFIGDTDDVLLPIYGAPYQVAFQEAEDRGIGEEFLITVNFKDLPRDADGNPIGGREVFAPLRGITRAEHIPYVVVLDHYGNAWNAHVALSEGIGVEPGHRYTVRLTVTPVTDRDEPVELP